jgi:hypothetical protein
MNPNMRALSVHRPGYQEDEILYSPGMEDTRTRKVETIMPLEQYQAMQQGSPSEVPQEMLDPEMMRRMGM